MSQKKIEFFNFDTREDGAEELYLYDEIGFWGTTAEMFKQELNARSGKHITLYVNSPGGSVVDGIAIHNLLARHKGGLTACIDGIAASIASVIVMAADTIKMPSNTLLMIHKPSTFVAGGEAEMEQAIDALKRAEAVIRSTYEKRMKENPSMSLDDLLDGKDHYLLASEAVEIFDNIEGGEGIDAAPYNLAVAMADSKLSVPKAKIKEIEGVRVKSYADPLHIEFMKIADEHFKASDSASAETETTKPNIEMENTRETELTNRIEVLEAENKLVAEKAAKDALAAEETRVAGILAATEKCKGKVDLTAKAFEAIQNKTTVVDFKDVVIDAIAELPVGEAIALATEPKVKNLSEKDQLIAKIEDDKTSPDERGILLQKLEKLEN